MSLRLEMLQVARLAPGVLGEAAALVREFLRGQQNPDGGFKDRAGQSDLYYTVFGLDALAALQAEADTASAARFVESFGSGEGLDFVHLCCLARCRAALGLAPVAAASAGAVPEEIRRRIEAFRTGDGGYHPAPGATSGTVYGAFLAFGAYQDLGRPLPDPLKLVRSLKRLETPDGAWANETGLKTGATNATAAAVTVLRNLRMPINPAVGEWLLARGHPQGGFVAAPGAPLPDLLSTATALHALAGLEVSFAHLKEACLDFVDSLWTNQGGFHGHWADDTLDCEYTFYALLALGHLSL